MSAAMRSMGPYLPQLGDLANVVITWGVGVVLLLAGSAIVSRREPAELRIAAGWGALCLLLTCWGVFVPVSLRVPAIAFAACALALQLAPGRRLTRADGVAAGRLLAVSLPLWLVMAPIRPSQPDTFLNLLPNAMYLVDYGRLPTSALPPSHSLLPAAPYNTQFLAYLGALANGGYPGPGMSLINVMLVLIAGMAMARALMSETGAAGAAPSWGMMALGMLLAALLNPGFVPRVTFAPYGETALAVTAVLAAWLFVLNQGRLARGEPVSGYLPLALVLAAMINAKQSGIGLVCALAGAALIAGWFERAVPRGPLLRRTALALLPAACLFGLWRYYVAHAGVAELVLLPFGQWHWATIPRTIASAAAEIGEKPTYYSCVLLALAAFPICLRRDGWTATTRLLAFHAAAFVLYNGFLLAAYIAHFSNEMSAEAHSYFRYSTHLSLVLVLALAFLTARLGGGEWLARHRRRVGRTAVAVALATPVGFAVRLRFDRDMPQPLVWRLADRVKPLVANGERLALLLPGDNGSLAAMLGGILTDAPPRRRLDLLRLDETGPAALAEAARRGYRHALISCTPGDTAELVERVAGRWRPVEAWPYPSDDTSRRWQHIVSWRPLCREP